MVPRPVASSSPEPKALTFARTSYLVQCYNHIENPDNLIFVGKVQWDTGTFMGHMVNECEQRYVQYVYLQFLLPHLQITFTMAHEHRISVAPYAWDSEYKVSVSLLQLNKLEAEQELERVLTAQRSHTFHLNQNFPWTQKWSILKKTWTTKEAYHTLSNLCISTAYTQRRKGKAKATYGSSPCQYSLNHQWMNGSEIFWHVSTSRSETKIAESVLCRSSTLPVRMEYICMYELLKMNCTLSVTPQTS